ncbi:oligosaccharide flippase family protein [Erythrobacter sp. LQ02-29]|uniref:lipopolysaccharide biosynthesis protein n=1 Tax=Erythrobacter sp. LQ02-29 TaxID=2920384 RepID=UPI001F4E5BF2|nr:oligosaccharide flippase family protein [Erythrobacter sp. LQ02-29]MCP9222647.1 oligosaccharide flippase family protein [Erythrobacter sp. LQ02-29]
MVETAQQQDGDMAALAKGGRTNFIGFLLRLVARIPFLFIAGQLYGAQALGRFASALVVVELLALVCSMGEKRGLAQRLANSDEPESNLVLDGLLLALLLSVIAGTFLWFVPDPMFPNGMNGPLDKLLVFAIPGFAMTEVALAAQAYRFDIATTVRARSLAEPWTISIAAGVLYFVAPASGLALAYLASIYAALIVALWPFLKTFGRPQGWRPRPRNIGSMTLRALPLAGADAVEWGSRRLDIFILGLFAAPYAVGIYYVAQQVASLPQKMKTSFEPILGPVITKNLKKGDNTAIADQLSQVGFWIIAAQAGIGLALGLPGEGVMGLVGSEFVGGTGALGFLLLAEVVAATAVVSEAALVYVARIKNLWISLATIGLQAVLTVGAMLGVERMGLAGGYKAAGAAIALMLSLGLAALIKAKLLGHILGQPIRTWRWVLVWAAVPATAVGITMQYVVEWAQLLFGIPLILFVYGIIIWTRGFGPEDRLLFRRNLASDTEPLPPEPGPESTRIR